MPRPPRRIRKCVMHFRRNRLLTYQLLTAILLFPILTWLAMSSLANHTTIGMPAQLLQAQNVLVVTAHPDDESLFFGPTILRLTGQNIRTSLLVLSSGNHYGLGEVRKSEQQQSCSVFGTTNCDVLDVPELQDDPTVHWPHDAIEKAVTSYVNKWHIDAIITFDEGGVSGHRNHIAVGAAIRSGPLPRRQDQPNLISERTTPLVFTLKTTGVLRKYSSLGDMPLTLLGFAWTQSSGTTLCVNSFSMWWKGVRAFQQHETQNSWDRHLYAVLSRYMWFNTLQVVED